MDLGHGHDHVEDLLEGEVVADLVRVLRGGKEGPAGGEDARAVATEDGVVAVRVLEQLGRDVPLAGEVREEPA